MGKQIELVHLAGPFGDCCSSYAVKFPTDMTVQEFIETVVAENPGEWGRIGFGWNHPKLAEYNHGSIIYTSEYAKYKSKKIIKVDAHGGWSLMDYNITLKEGKY